MDRAVKANLIEKIHAEYILEALNVQSSSPGAPDFYTDKHFFEMKSRTSRFCDEKESNAWWSLSQPQIESYEEFPGKNGLMWMFVHAFTQKPLEALNSEKSMKESVVHRDIFIAPWGIYKKFPLQREGPAKRGPYRTISRRHLKSRVEFTMYRLRDGLLHTPRDMNLGYLIRT